MNGIITKDLIVVQESSLAEPQKEHKIKQIWEKVKFSVVAAIKYLPKLFSFNTSSEAVEDENSLR